MNRLMVKDKDAHNSYTLIDDSGDIVNIIFEFHNVKNPPEIGDYIFWSNENYLEGKFDAKDPIINFGLRAYGPFEKNSCCRTGANISETDFIVIVKKDETYLLHRYYG